ncbi:hypothetical protein Tco_0471891 [Tanacetum coccineum]
MRSLRHLIGGTTISRFKCQPLLDDASLASLSPGYIADSDPEEDPADYPADGGDDTNDESSDNDDDDNVEEGKEVEEHLALADSSAVLVNDPVPSAKDTMAFETDESAPTHVTSHRHARLE